MTLKEFQKEDLRDLIYLHETQGCTTDGVCDPRTLPQIGYLAYENGCVAAAGFLRLIEGGFAQLDTLVSNGTYPPHIRHKCVGGIVDRLIERAKHLELKGIISLTTDEGIVRRAISLGFSAQPQFVLTLPFT